MNTKNKKNQSPFTGKPAMGVNLANAVANIYNLEDQLRDLEKPSIPLHKAPKDQPKLLSKQSPMKTQNKASSSKTTNAKPKQLLKKIEVEEVKYQEKEEKIIASVQEKVNKTIKKISTVYNPEKIEEISSYFFLSRYIILNFH